MLQQSAVYFIRRIFYPPYILSAVYFKGLCILLSHQIQFDPLPPHGIIFCFPYRYETVCTFDLLWEISLPPRCHDEHRKSVHVLITSITEGSIFIKEKISFFLPNV